MDTRTELEKAGVQDVSLYGIIEMVLYHYVQILFK